MVVGRTRYFEWLLLVCMVLLAAACEQQGSLGKDPALGHTSGPAPPNQSALSDASIGTKAGSSRLNKLEGTKEERRSGKKIPAKTQAISFDDIAFKMEKDEMFSRSMLTKKITNYVGKDIKLRGYILPSFKQDGLTQFVLVRDNMECCFGPGAALYDCVMVQMRPGKSTSFSVRPVTIEGNFKIDEWKDFDGVIRAIYHLEGESVY